jgi:hypothetical protein
MTGSPQLMTVPQSALQVLPQQAIAVVCTGLKYAVTHTLWQRWSDGHDVARRIHEHARAVRQGFEALP